MTERSSYRAEIRPKQPVRASEGQVTAVIPLTERDVTYVRSVREHGAGNGPPTLFFDSSNPALRSSAEGIQLMALAAVAMFLANLFLAVRMSRLSLARILGIRGG